VVGDPGAVNQAAPLSYLQANFAAINNVVNSFNGRQGSVSLSSGDVTGALGYAPANLAGSAGQQFNVANATASSEAVALGQFTNSLNGSNDTSIIQRPDGVIEQWLQTNVTTGGSGTYSFAVNFPEAFPTDCTGAVVGFRSTVPVPGSCGWTGASNSQITIVVDTDAAQTVNISIAAIGI